MKNIDELKSMVKDYLQNSLEEFELAALYTEFEAAIGQDRCAYAMEDINIAFEGMSPEEVLDASENIDRKKAWLCCCDYSWFSSNDIWDAIRGNQFIDDLLAYPEMIHKHDLSTMILDYNAAMEEEQKLIENASVKQDTFQREMAELFDVLKEAIEDYDYRKPLKEYVLEKLEVDAN